MSTLLENIKAYYQRLVPVMSNQDWNVIESKLTYRTLPKGAFLGKAGEVCRHVSFVNRGLIRFYYLYDGKEVVTGFIDGQEYISDYRSFLLQAPSDKYMEVLEEAELAELSYQDVQELYRQNIVFQTFGRKIAERLFIMFDQNMGMLATQSPEERYKTLVQNQSTLLQRIPQYMLASYLGITPEHLSRIRKKMSAQPAIDKYQ